MTKSMKRILFDKYRSRIPSANADQLMTIWKEIEDDSSILAHQADGLLTLRQQRGVELMMNAKLKGKRILSITIKRLVMDSGDVEDFGVRAEAGVKLTADTSGLFQVITSGGLWEIDIANEPDNSYVCQVEQEQLTELRGQLHAIGFSQRAITVAFKDVVRK